MKHQPALAAALLLSLLAPAGLLAQQAPASAESQLRDALRTTTLELRTAQSGLAALQAEKDQAAAQIDSLKKQLDAITRAAESERKTLQTNLNNLNNQLTQKTTQATRLAEKLKLALDERDAAANLAQTRANELAANQLARTELDRANASLRSDNRELFRLGMEVLERYENFGLGKAITAREPFTRLTRVNMQNLVQNYRDQLEDNRAKLPTKPAAAEPVAPAQP